MLMPSNASGMEIGILVGTYPGRIGHLYSPEGQRGPWPEVPFAGDNRKFPKWIKGQPWDESEWRRFVLWVAMSGQPPLWMLCPDEVADRDGTLRAWDTFSPWLSSFGFRLAFAVQDGMTFEDVPDDRCVLFLGGSTDWKEAAIEPWCSRFPGRVHVGRVNYWPRLIKSWRAGAISVDGTGWYHKNSGQLAQFKKFLRETSEATRAA